MAKTKALISFAVTAKLICVFVFAYAKSPFSHDVAHLKCYQTGTESISFSDFNKFCAEKLFFMMNYKLQ